MPATTGSHADHRGQNDLESTILPRIAVGSIFTQNALDRLKSYLPLMGYCNDYLFLCLRSNGDRICLTSSLVFGKLLHKDVRVAVHDLPLKLWVRKNVQAGSSRVVRPQLGHGSFSSSMIETNEVFLQEEVAQ